MHFIAVTSVGTTSAIRNFRPDCLRSAHAKHVFSLPADHWLHEVKYDGYCLIVARDQNRVRLITSGGHDWAGRFPWIVEAALKNCRKQFVIDGEAVVLGRRE